MVGPRLEGKSLSRDPFPRLVINNGPCVPRTGILSKVGLEPLIKVGRDPASSGNPVKKLPIFRNDRRQPRLGNALPFGELLCIAQQLVLKGHYRSSLLTELHHAVCVPRLSRGRIPDAYVGNVRDTALMDLEGLKDRLRARLAATNLSARAASLKAGMGVDVVRHILNGKSRNPKHQTIERLSTALDCTYEWLATGSGTAPTDSEDAADEQSLVDEYRELSADGKAAIRQMIRAIKTAQEPTDIPV